MEVLRVIKDSLVIFNKETASVLRDKRAVFTNLVLPLILMPAILGFIGFIQNYQTQKRADTEYSIAIVNEPGPVLLAGATTAFEVFLADWLTFNTQIEPHSNQGVTVEFPADFSWQQPQAILVYADTSRQDLTFAASRVQAAIQEINRQLGEARLAALGLDTQQLYPLQSELVSLAPDSVAEAGEGRLFLSSVLPYMVILYLFTGSVALALSVTAGEKERGSLASLLVNQVDRTAISLGKTLAIMAIAIINALASSVGLLIGALLFSQLIGGFTLSVSGSASLLGGIATPWGSAALVLIILSAASVSSSLVVFIGSRVRTVREGNSVVAPVTMALVIFAMMIVNMNAAQNEWMFIIPFINAVVVMKSIILGLLQPAHLAISLLANLVVTAILVYLTAREFNLERVLFTE